MVRRNVLIAALLIAALGALGMAAAAAPNEPEPMDLPAVVLPRNTPQEAAQTREGVFTITRHTARVKNAVGRTQMATQLPAKRPHRA